MKILVLMVAALFFSVKVFGQTYHFDYTLESKYGNDQEISSVEYHDSVNNTNMHFVKD